MSLKSVVEGNGGGNDAIKANVPLSDGNADVKPDMWPAAAPGELRRMLQTPQGPSAAELAKFRELAEVKTGFEDMKRNMLAATSPAAFEKYKEGWNSICDLLQEVVDLRKCTAELDAENDMLLELMEQVSKLKIEVARLKKENQALRQDNADMKESLHSKLSVIEAWVRIDTARARAQETGDLAATSAR